MSKKTIFTKTSGVLMATLLSLTVIGCGGSSSSSDDSKEVNKQEQTKTNTNTDNTSKIKECVKGDDNLVHVTTTGCTYAIPRYNGGRSEVYICKDGRIQGSISGKTVTLNNVTLTCK